MGGSLVKSAFFVLPTAS